LGGFGRDAGLFAGREMTYFFWSMIRKSGKPVFRKRHAQLQSWSDNRFNLKRLRRVAIPKFASLCG
jgi:hypothetical protein